MRKEKDEKKECRRESSNVRSLLIIQFLFGREKALILQGFAGVEEREGCSFVRQSEKASWGIGLS